MQNIVSRLNKRSKQLSKRTVRLYRAAISNYIEECVASGMLSPGDASHFVNLMVGVVGKSIGSATSSFKAKSASHSTIEKLNEKLARSNSWLAELATVMFESTLYTGLRPCEWFDAKLSRGVLIVKNAKATNGRSNGEYRQISLDSEFLNITPKIISSIKKTILLCDQYSQIKGGDDDLIIRDLGQVVRRAKIKSGGRCVSMYTARHQFSANMKAAGLSADDIANLMGHASNKTASIHYGKKRSGHPEFHSKNIHQKVGEAYE